MKAVKVLFLLSAVLVGFAAAGELTQTVRFAPGSISLGAQTGFATVQYQGARLIDQVGMPALPELPLQLVVPPTAVVTGIEIKNLVENQLPGVYNVMPAQTAGTWGLNDPVRPFVPPNAKVYASNAMFPSAPAILQHQGDKGGFHIAGMTTYPVRYEPAAHRLYSVSQFDVVVHYQEQPIPMPRRFPEQIRLMSSDLFGMVANPQDIHRFAPAVKNQGDFSALLPPGYYEYVIVTPQAYADSFVALRDWRTLQGMPAKIVMTESICATYSGRDTAEQIRNFEKDAYATWGTSFFFLPRNDYPAQEYRDAFCNGGDGQPYTFPSDLYFSDLDGSWDGNHNGVFGECPGDSINGYSDVYVGMITIDNSTWQTDVHNFTSKLFRYEQNPGTGYEKKVLLPVGIDQQNFRDYAESIGTCVPSDWFVGRFYTPTGDENSFLDSIQAGYGYVSGIHHANADLIAHGSGNLITSSDAIALTNQKLGVFITVGCEPGEWDGAGSVNGDCLAENIITHSANGFAAVMMNSQSGWMNSAEFYNFEFMRQLLPFNPPLCSNKVYVGQALARAKDYWIPNWRLDSDTGDMRFDAYERNLFGDPAMPLWTNDPDSVIAIHNSVVPLGMNVPYNVTVTSSGGTPVESALVLLWKGNECYTTGRTNASGQATIYVSTLTPGKMIMTVNAHNYYLHQDSVLVASGRYLTYYKSGISDPPPGGNGDSMLNPGETVNIPLWVRNWGNLTASGVKATLRSLDPNATVLDSVRSVGAIPASDSVLTPGNGFQFRAADTCSDGHQLSFRLVCRDTMDSIWSSDFKTTVRTCVLGYADKRVRDPRPNGNNNGRMDPGEKDSLFLCLRDTGLGRAYNVHATLRSHDSRFQILDSTSIYSRICCDTTGENTSQPFYVHIDSSVPPETQFPCTLLLSGDNHYSAVLPISIEVGELRTVDPIHDNAAPPVYWAVDNVDSGYTNRPDFHWIEARGQQCLHLGLDKTCPVTLPAAFGPIKFYNQRTTFLSVCSNGWVTPGNTSNATGANTSLPTNALPGAVCANWTELSPTYNNNVWVYFDSIQHAYVVEYDSLPYADSTLGADKFEIVIYDTTRAAANGTNQFVVQYLTANGYHASTLGIQDQTQQYAICCLFDTTYNRGTAQIKRHSAIEYTADPVRAGIDDKSEPAKLPLRLSLNAPGNPFRGTAHVAFSLPAKMAAKLTVYDAIGRQVQVLTTRGETYAPGAYVVTWNGSDETGRTVPGGVYFCRLETAQGALACKVVKLD